VLTVRKFSLDQGEEAAPEGEGLFRQE